MPRTKKKAAQRIIGQDANRRALAVAIERNIPVLLVGDTGTGKTSLLRELAEQHKTTLHRVNLNGESTPDEIIGKWIVQQGDLVWVDGLLIRAMTEGHWIVLDEVNAALPEILFALHSLLDDDRFVVLTDKMGEVIHPHEDFRVFACMNPSEEYVGTKELNKAFLSRWRMRLQFGYLDPRKESKVLQERTPGLSTEDARMISDFAAEVRRAKQEDRIFTTLSHRDTLAWASLVDVFGMEAAFKYTCRDLFKQEEHAEVQQAWASAIGCVEKAIRYDIDGVRPRSLHDFALKLRNERHRVLEMQERLRVWQEQLEQERREVDLSAEDVRVRRSITSTMLHEVRESRIALAHDFEAQREELQNLREEMLRHLVQGAALGGR